jgi:hypothetical protein
MKRGILMFAVALGTLAGPLCAENDDEAAARRVAYSVAGAFTNDGFNLREGHWTGRVEPGKPKIVQVNLYAGNQYWFSVGTTPLGKKIALSIYDETGKPLASEPYSGNGKAAAGFSPEASGPYYVKVEVKDGEPSTFCLLYSYK